jgi:hypothetical protein
MSVVVLPGSTLELRGFTITGGNDGVACYDVRERPDLPPGLYTGGSCRVDGGGGRIVNSVGHGIGGTRVNVANVTIDGAGQEGVSADIKIRLQNVTITNCLGQGAAARGVQAIDSTITGSGEDGIAASNATLSGSTVTGNGVGSECGSPFQSRPCADLLTKVRPHLKRSTLRHEPWHAQVEARRDRLGRLHERLIVSTPARRRAVDTSRIS